MYGIFSYIYQRFTPMPYMDDMGMGDDFMMLHVRVRLMNLAYISTINPLTRWAQKPANKWSYNAPKWGQITPHIAIDKAIYRGPPLFHPVKITRFLGPIQTRCCTTWCWSIPSWPPRNWASKLALLPPIRAQALAWSDFFKQISSENPFQTRREGSVFFVFFKGTYNINPRIVYRIHW